MSDLSALKALSKAREGEEKRLADRRRAILVLMLRHLADHGYSETYERLSVESNLSLGRVDVADNMDLMRILQEFEEGHEFKYGKRPKLIKRLTEEVSTGGGGTRVRAPSARGGAGVAAGGLPPVSGSSGPGNGNGNGNGALSPPTSRHTVLEGPPVGGAMAARQRRAAGAGALAGAEEGRRAEALERRTAAMNSVKPPPEVGGQRVAGVALDGRGNGALQGLSREEVNGMQIQGLNAVRQVREAMAAESAFPNIGQQQQPQQQPQQHQHQQHANRGSSFGGAGGSDSDGEDYFERRVLKPLPASLQGELRELGAALQRDIFTESPCVRWGDISGLDTAKRLLGEAVVAPMRYPELFTGLLAPWKGLLLFGPPGTGKTMLAKAVATECRTTFFNISASSIVSKWRGDSEKLVRVLFELARHHAPSTIFLDELDALMGARGGEGEHEASRRMKTELLVQMDGLATSPALVFVLCATNLPWELDMAMMRRLEKRIFVPLPTAAARAVMFQLLLKDRLAEGEVSISDLADATDGFSGSDVTLLAKEAAMQPLRRLLAQLDSTGPAGGWAGGNGGPRDVRHVQAQQQQQQQQSARPQIGPITAQDVAAALLVCKASARLHEARYAQFNSDYGQAAT
ncbi:MAG: hypothetical protein WDW36_008933 [Sanguina aurantia]